MKLELKILTYYLLNLKPIVKMLGKLLLYFALLLWFVVPAKAQLTIIFPETEVVEGEEFTVDVRVKNFSDVIAAQFPVNFDPTVIEYIEADTLFLRFDANCINDDPNSPSTLDSCHFGGVGADTGTVAFIWVDPFFGGVNIVDDSLLFQLKFKAIGAGGSSTALVADPAVMPIEIGDFNGPFDTVAVQNGIITVSSSTSTDEVRSQGLTLYQNYPNPFKKQTLVPFAHRTAGDVSFSVYDQKGTLVFNQKQQYAAGFHYITIDHNDLPATGVFWYELKTKDAVATKKMILVK